MKSLFCLVSLFALVKSGFAIVIYIPADYPTIQAGIDASSNGDTVLVQPGIYLENLNFNGHNIVLGSLFLTTGDTSYVSTTIIDGNESGSVITFESGEDSTTYVAGFTIQNGSFVEGGGIRCNEYSRPNIWRNLIINNRAYAWSPNIIACGGGIYCAGNSNPHIIENTIRENSAISGHGDPFEWLGGSGAGIYCKESSPLIEGNLIEDNDAAYPFTVTGTGGGAYIDNNSSVQIVGNEFRGNSGVLGPAILSVNSNTVISNNIIENNLGLVDGAAAVYCNNTRSRVTFNIINNNEIGIECGNDSSLIMGNLIINGTGGIWINDSFVMIVNNIICRNGTEVYPYGGIQIDNSIGAIINSIIRESIGHPISIMGGEIEVSYCDIDGGWAGEGNIDTDPLFRVPDNGDFHLMSVDCGDSENSPCIDAGDPAMIDGLLDCVWGLGTERSDMGAYGGDGEPRTEIEDQKNNQVPARFNLSRNYPNPFNTSTLIEYGLPSTSNVTVEIYDILGRRIETLAQGEQPGGYHQVLWDAAEVSSGMYFYRIKAGDYTESRKMMLLK